MGVEIKAMESSVLIPIGEAVNMTQIQKKKAEQWTKEAVYLCNTYPDVVYLNGPCNAKGKTVYLTFDDGPDQKYTMAILGILDRYNIKASFFVHGKRAARLKKIVKKIDAEGHYIGCHTYSHPNLTEITKSAVTEEIKKSCSILYKTIGKEPDMIRPPYGDINVDVIKVIKDMGKKAILWSLNTYDWLEKDAERIKENVMNYTRNGEIILMHSYLNKQQTLKALPEIIEYLLKENYSFLRVDEITREGGEKV